MNLLHALTNVMICEATLDTFFCDSCHHHHHQVESPWEQLDTTCHDGLKSMSDF